MKRKICMVVPSFSAKGGIATVVSGYRNSELEEKYDVKYIESYCDGSKIRKILKAMGSYCLFLKEMVVNKPDIVHIHSSFGKSFYRKLPFVFFSNKFKVPVINHIHGADFNTFYISATEKKKIFIKKVYNQCSKVIVLSDEWKTNFKSIVSENKITVVENYSLIDETIISRRKNKKNQYKVLFLGFVCSRKGCFDIPDIVKKVVEKIPEAIFIIAGDGEIDSVKKITDSSIEEHIVYPGWVRDCEKKKYLCDSDLFFLPSYHEGMPMCILDAMGCGLPVVSTSVGGISKIVWDGQNGFLHEPGDKEKISESIIELLCDNNLRKEFGEKSIEIAKKYFSLEKHVDRISRLYDSF